MIDNHSSRLSQQLLMAVKKGESYDAFISQLKNTSLDRIKHDLADDALKKAFWINIYNAFYQIIRQDGGQTPKSRIYNDRIIIIGGTNFSLDDIEHGILRRYRHKKALGYLPDFFVNGLIKELAVNKIDYRIHFALNCGAESCPPIRFYTPHDLNNQLEVSTISFLDEETDLDDLEKRIRVSRLFLWFLGDFGGKKGIRKILREKIKVNKPRYKLKFKSYSWEDKLNYFVNY